MNRSKTTAEQAENPIDRLDNLLANIPTKEEWRESFAKFEMHMVCWMLAIGGIIIAILLFIIDKQG